MFAWMQDGGNENAKLSEEMQDSYQQAALRAGKDNNQPLHVIDRFPIRQDQWDYMVRSTSMVPDCAIKDEHYIFDAGCGAGAYLDSLLRMNPKAGLKVAGIDFAPGLIDIAKNRLPPGSLLRVGDARSYPDVPSNTFDLSLSFGVFFYFDGDDDVRAGLKELTRVTKPGGRVMVGRMNSKEIIDQIPAEIMKRNYASYFPRQARVDSKTFWKDEAEVAGLEFLGVKAMNELYDLQQCGDACMGRLRHCAYFRKLETST